MQIKVTPGDYAPKLKHGKLISWPMAYILSDAETHEVIGIAIYQRRLADNVLEYYCSELDKRFKLQPKES